MTSMTIDAAPKERKQRLLVGHGIRVAEFDHQVSYERIGTKTRNAHSHIQTYKHYMLCANVDATLTRGADNFEKRVPQNNGFSQYKQKHMRQHHRVTLLYFWVVFKKAFDLLQRNH